MMGCCGASESAEKPAPVMADAKEALAQRVANINLSEPEQVAGATPRGIDVEVRTTVVVLAQLAIGYR